jgi:hypothetical protein
VFERFRGARRGRRSLISLKMRQIGRDRLIAGHTGLPAQIVHAD